MIRGCRRGSTSATSSGSRVRTPARRPGPAAVHPAEAERPVASQAARFAAKEALAKALGAPGRPVLAGRGVVTDDQGRPEFKITGTVAARAAELGVGDHPRQPVPRRRDRLGRGGLRGLMIEAYGVETIRALEAAAIERVGDDTLMQRAAAGLAARWPGSWSSCAAGSTGPGSWSWWARATTAGTRCSPGPGWPGARSVTAVRCLGSRTARPCRAASGRRPDPRVWTIWSDAPSTAGGPPRLDFDLAVDGVLGIGGRPGLP